MRLPPGASMFPMVPNYNLPALHAELKADMPKPYNGLWEAYREIIPAIIRQTKKEPTYFVRRELRPPAESGSWRYRLHNAPSSRGSLIPAVFNERSISERREHWVEACGVGDVRTGGRSLAFDPTAIITLCHLPRCRRRQIFTPRTGCALTRKSISLKGS